MEVPWDQIATTLPVGCPHCHKRVRNLSDLYLHMEAKHPDAWEALHW